MRVVFVDALFFLRLLLGHTMVAGAPIPGLSLIFLDYTGAQGYKCAVHVIFLPSTLQKLTDDYIAITRGYPISCCYHFFPRIEAPLNISNEYIKVFCNSTFVAFLYRMFL